MNIVNDKMSKTPETDAEVGDFDLETAVSSDFARRLERERNEAGKELSSIHRWIERNHADGFIDSLTYLQNLERVTDSWYDRIDAIETDARRFVRERNEARESLKHIGEYGTEEINAAVDLRQKLASALIERDEVQKAVNGLCKHLGVSPANTTLLAVEVLRIQRERDEAITRRMETIMQCELYEQERDEARENCKSIVDKANELIARWDQPSWKDTAPTAGFINALRIAVEAYEKKKP